MDTKDKLPPIPTPASQRWREFRIQVLPFVMFIAVIIAIVFLWRAYVQPIGVIGFAETNQVSVTSLSDGIIERMFIEPFQVVTQGQVIAIVAGTAPELLRAQFAAVQSELEVTRDRLKVDLARVDQNIQQFEQDLLRYTIDQAADSQTWQLRSNELARARQLYADKSLSQSDFERTKDAFDRLSAQVAERENGIASLRKTLADMRKLKSPDGPSSIDIAIQAKAKELELQLKPSVLLSPIDGMVTAIHRRQGERLRRGTSLATISDPQARRVIGYVRQPVSLLPTTNDTVKILKRTAPAAVGQGRIERVGAQFEFINPALLSTESKRMEVGLPILVSVPPGFPLVPGEYVTLTIDYAR